MIVDDQQLVRLAADQPSPLFPISNRSEAFKPLLVVLALIPGMLTIPFDHFSSYDAQFVMDSLEHWKAPFAGHFSLAHWMTGFTLHLTEFSLSWRFLLPTYLFSVLLVLMLFYANRTVLNSRCGYLSVLLMLMHPVYLEQLTHQVTPICSLFCLLVAIWGYYQHLKQDSFFSPYLLAGAVACGVNMFSLPIMSYFVLAWILCEITLSAVVELVSKKGSGSTLASRNHSFRYRLLSLGGMCGITASCGFLLWSLKWVEVEQFGIISTEIPFVTWNEESILGAINKMTTLFLGFCVLGLGLTLKNFLKSNPEANGGRFWFLGFCVSGYLWLSNDRTTQLTPDLVQTWKLLFLICSFGMVSIAINQIIERKITLQLIFLIVGIAFAFLVWHPLQVKNEWSLYPQIIGTVVLALLLWKCFSLCQGDERRTRLTLNFFLICLFSLHSLLGYLSLKQDRFLAQNYLHFQEEISEASRTSNVFLVISEAGLQPNLQALLQLQWLEQPIEHCKNWNEAITRIKNSDLGSPPQVMIVNLNSQVAPDLTSSLPGWELHPLGQQHFLQQYRLTSYVAQHQ